MKKIKKTLSLLLALSLLLMLIPTAVPASNNVVTVYKLNRTMDESFTTSTLASVTTITENGVSNKVCSPTKQNADGYIAGKQDSSITDAVYEAGYTIKTGKGKSSSDKIATQLSYNRNYPVLNATLEYNSSGDIVSVYIDSIRHTFAQGVWKQGEWNDVRYKITDDKTGQKFSVDMYVNSAFVYTFNYNYTANQKADVAARVGYPCNWRLYKFGDETVISYIDDVYIARYTPVTTFVQEETVAEVTADGEKRFPKTVAATVDGTVQNLDVNWGDFDSAANTVKGLFKDYGVDLKATAAVETVVRSYSQDFQGKYTPAAGHTVETENAGINKYLQIKKSIEWDNTIFPNMSLSPSQDAFKTGFRFRLPDMRGLVADKCRPTFQIGTDTNNQILQIAFDPYNDDGVSVYNRIRVTRFASADSSLAILDYSLWVNEFDRNFDWTAWHTLEAIFRNGKVAIALDGNILSDGKQGAAYQWKDVRTDISFNMIRFAHRYDNALNIEAITNLDDFYVDTYYRGFTEDITAEPMSFALNETTVNSSNASSDYATLNAGKSFDYTVNTAKAGAYLLLYTGGTKEQVKMDVFVNGKLEIDDVLTGNTQSYGERLPHELGAIELKPGKNVIRFTAINAPIVSTQFSLSKTRSAKTVAINADTVTAYQNVTIGNRGADMVYSEGSEAYIETEVPVVAEGWYGVKVNAAVPASLSLRISANGSATVRNVKSTSSDTVFENSYVGMLYLKEGKHTVRISPLSGSGCVSSFTFDEIDYDLTDAQRNLSIDIDKETVSGMNNVSDSAATDNAVTISTDSSFTVTVNAESALNYAVGAQYLNENSGKTIDVTVNGYKQISGADADSSIGYINLKRGLNEITFTLAEGEALAIDSLSLSLADSFIDGEHKMWVQKDRVANASFTSGTNAGFSTSGGSPCATMRLGSYVEFDVYTNCDRYVYLTVDTASPDEALLSFSVNGEVLLSERTPKLSVNYSNYATYEAKTVVRIPAGYSTVRFTQVDYAGNLRSLTLNEHTGDETILKKFELQMENGVRAPYVVRDGFTGYAAAEILKLGTPVDAYSLMIAQYDNGGKLVDVKKTDIDVSDMKDRETKTFRVPLTYKGNGGTVKGFILEKDTLIPEKDALVCDEPQFFSDKLFDETITYTLATNVKNSAGEYYADYSLHDENYDIDAIFYDSVVGEQTKVFAYIGVPKGASEENPVPAVVCVHGGGGVAYIDWVKKWNDEGYAAIAMTLSGDGPAALSASGEDPTPYRGMECWGNNAFIKDYQNATMYQNVTNVVRAHNLLRQWPGVDETKTGITGISWGGVTTTITIGVDNRFKFAVPVYGGGYLDLDETYFAAYIKTPDSTLKWDPANFAARSTMPVLFINGDSDHSFSINTTSLTESVTPNARLSIRHKFSHAHSSGRAPQEIYAFADGVLKGYDPFITINSAAFENQQMSVSYSAPAGITVESAELYYITDIALPYGGEIDWKKVSTHTNNGSTVVFDIPEDATFCYATLTDNSGNLISTNFTQVK